MAVSISANPTVLIEEEGTVLTITLNSDEPIPEGGLTVTIDSPTENALGQLDVFAAQFSNGRFVRVNDTTSGFDFLINASPATIAVPIFDDQVDDAQDITFALQPGEGYTIDSSAGSVTLSLQDADGTPTEGGEGGEGVVSPDNIDFEVVLEVGDVVTNQFDGLTISTPDNSFGAMIFDSANPTGGDTDLLAPEKGNVLIISEDGDSADPDDNMRGGILRFEWDELTNIGSVGVLDIEEAGSKIKLYDSNDMLIQVINIEGIGDNSIQDVSVGISGVTRMDVVFSGSGALTDINFLSAADAA